MVIKHLAFAFISIPEDVHITILSVIAILHHGSSFFELMIVHGRKISGMTLKFRILKEDHLMKIRVLLIHELNGKDSRIHESWCSDAGTVTKILCLQTSQLEVQMSGVIPLDTHWRNKTWLPLLLSSDLAAALGCNDVNPMERFSSCIVLPKKFCFNQSCWNLFQACPPRWQW